MIRNELFDQALSAEYCGEDKRVLKLESMGIKIDRLSPEQEEYLAGWSEGT